MDNSLLVRTLGFPATLIHGDTSVLDRWRWLKRRLPLTANGETLLDVGCGTGGFTIGAARRGYRAVGVSWDERNQRIAQERAQLCKARDASFVIGDVRQLAQIPGLAADYDVLICMECVEHILDDRKLFRDMANRLKPGGQLLLSTPNYFYHPISKGDRGPFMKEETGWHVRRGYTPAMLQELCAQSGLTCAAISYCTGYLSQKMSWIWRWFDEHVPSKGLNWIITLPLRTAPIVLPDERATRWIGWPLFSICLEAYKPRFPAGAG